MVYRKRTNNIICSKFLYYWWGYDTLSEVYWNQEFSDIIRHFDTPGKFNKFHALLYKIVGLLNYFLIKSLLAHRENISFIKTLDFRIKIYERTCWRTIVRIPKKVWYKCCWYCRHSHKILNNTKIIQVKSHRVTFIVVLRYF